MNTQNHRENKAESILRLPDVMQRTGLKRSTIYLRIQEGTFPKQIDLGIRCAGWLESEINAWIASRVAASRNHIPKPT